MAAFIYMLNMFGLKLVKFYGISLNMNWLELDEVI